ncbi:MAG: hypothetical protein AAB425_07685, partial [Bdellovibrionota bacterium]
QPDPPVCAEQWRSIQGQAWSSWSCAVTFDSPVEDWACHPLAKPFFEDTRFRWSENHVRLGSKQNFAHAMRIVSSVPGVHAIACADQDDVWYPQKLETLARALASKPPLSLVHCDMHVLVNGIKQEQTAWQVECRGVKQVELRHFLIRNVVAGAAMLVDAELVRRFDQVSDEAEYHDHWYAALASAHGGVYAVNEPLFAYRQHGGNVVGVSPYRGRFWLPSSVRSVSDVLAKCKAGFRKSLRLAQAVDRAGCLRNPMDRLAFLSRREPGVLIAGLGISNWFKDPPLARACLARGVGKLLDTFTA